MELKDLNVQCHKYTTEMLNVRYTSENHKQLYIMPSAEIALKC